MESRANRHWTIFLISTFIVAVIYLAFDGWNRQVQAHTNELPLGIRFTESNDSLTVTHANRYARQFGLKVGDIISHVQSRRVRTGQDLLAALESKQPHDRVYVALKRGTDFLAIDEPFPGALGVPEMVPEATGDTGSRVDTATHLQIIDKPPVMTEYNTEVSLSGTALADLPVEESPYISTPSQPLNQGLAASNGSIEMPSTSWVASDPESFADVDSFGMTTVIDEPVTAEIPTDDSEAAHFDSSAEAFVAELPRQRPLLALNAIDESHIDESREHDDQFDDSLQQSEPELTETPDVGTGQYSESAADVDTYRLPDPRTEAATQTKSVSSTFAVQTPGASAPSNEATSPLNATPLPPDQISQDEASSEPQQPAVALPDAVDTHAPTTVTSAEPVDSYQSLPVAVTSPPSNASGANDCQPSYVQHCCKTPTPELLVGGWFSAGYHSESNDLFDDRPDELNLHQAWLYIAKPATRTSRLGYRADVIYGIDGENVQAFGNDPGKWDFENGFDHGAYAWAIPQAFMELQLGDWNVQAGKFLSLFGYEKVPAPENFFYSRSIALNNSEPFTHTGVLASRSFDNRLHIFGGWTLGWDTGYNQFGGGSSYLAGIRYDVSDRISVAYSSTAGDLGSRGDDAFSQIFVMDVRLNQCLNWIVQSDLLRVEETGEDNFGLTQYLLYRMSDRLGVGGRMEWWKGDVLTGYAPHGGVLPAGGSLSYYAATAGLNYHPYQNLIMRPEARYDWSPAANYDRFYVGVDAILKF